MSTDRSENMSQVLRAKLSEALTPAHLSIENESHRHNVPAGSESHFKVVVASESFAGLSRVARHRMVNKVLADELASSIHALALHALTPEEFEAREGTVAASPDCHGGDGQRVIAQ